MAPPFLPTLYHVPWFCSSIAAQLVAELSIPPTALSVVTLTPVELRTGPEILAVSPRRVVPALALPDGTCITEVGAIVMYILETFDGKGTLHPKVGPERARFLQALFYVVSECYKAAFAVFLMCFSIKPKLVRLDREERDAEKWKEVTGKFKTVVVDHIVREIGDAGRKYYLGDKLSAADFMFGYILMWVDSCDEGLLDHPVVQEYYGRLKARPMHIKLYLES